MLGMKLVGIVLLTLVSAIIGFSQQTEENMPVSADPRPKVAIKIDEFGKTNDEEVEARIDNLFAQLNNNPDAKGYIITYNGLDSMPSEYDSSPMRKRIVKALAFRKYDVSRLTYLDGGFRETVTTEFFMVPPHGIPPKPTDTVPKPEMPKDSAFLWGKSVIGGWADEEDPLNELILPAIKAKQDEEMAKANAELATALASDDKDTAADEQVADDTETEPELSAEEKEEISFSWANERFGSEIFRHKKATGVLIFYADDQYYDINKLRYYVEQGRARIANTSKIDVSRIQVIFGGYRDQPQSEFWIVPANGEIPVAKPDERPVDTPDAN